MLHCHEKIPYANHKIRREKKFLFGHFEQESYYNVIYEYFPDHALDWEIAQ